MFLQELSPGSNLCYAIHFYIFLKVVKKFHSVVGRTTGFLVANIQRCWILFCLKIQYLFGFRSGFLNSFFLLFESALFPTYVKQSNVFSTFRGKWKKFSEFPIFNGPLRNFNLIMIVDFQSKKFLLKKWFNYQFVFCLTSNTRKTNLKFFSRSILFCNCYSPLRRITLCYVFCSVFKVTFVCNYRLKFFVNAYTGLFHCSKVLN